MLLTVEQALDLGTLRRPLVRVREREQLVPSQCVDRRAQQLGEGRVHLDEAPPEVDERHADRGVLHRDLELRLAPLERRLGLLPRRDVGEQGQDGRRVTVAVRDD